MAVAISDSNNRVEDMEGTPTIADVGSGKAGAKELITFLQGGASVSRKVTSATLAGTGVSVTAVDMTVGDDLVYLHKSLVTDYGDANSAGWVARIGSSVANTNDYILLDDGTLGDRGQSQTSLIRGGWIVEAIHLQNNDWWDAQPGSAPTLTAITHFYALVGLAAGGAKAENIFLDSVDLGDGLYLTGGTPDGTWADFLADDEGSQTAGRFGHAFSNKSGIELLGKFVRGRTAGGTVTATQFTDSLKSLTWVGGRVSAGWNALEDDLGNASTAIAETNQTFACLGRDNLKRWFDSENEVDGTNEVIQITGHGFKTGDAVFYSDEGGTAVTGLTDATRYFVNRDTGTGRDADGFSLHAARADAYTNTTPLGLTAAGTGEQHSFRRQPDTRGVYTAVSTSGTAVYTSCIWQRWAAHNATSGVTMDACTFVECSAYDLNQGKLTNCTIVTPLLAEGEAYCTTPDLSDISGCSVSIGEDGHFADIDTTGTYAFNDNILSGYWAHSNLNAGEGATFDTTSGAGVDATGEDITTDEAHGLTTGDAVYYNDNGGTDTIGLTDGDRYYVNVISTTNISLHVTKQDATTDTNRVALNATGTGEEHTFYSTKAAIVNSSGGLVTINVDGGTLPYVRNVGASTTVVNLSVPVTLTILDSDNQTIEGASVYVQDAAGPFNDTDQIIREFSDVTGVASENFSGSTPLTVRIEVAKAGFLTVPTSGIITPSGLNTSVVLNVNPNSE